MSHQMIETPGGSEEPNIDIFNNDNLFEDTSEEDDSEENEEGTDEENDEHNREEADMSAPTKKAKKNQLTPCVLMINRNGTIQRCGQINSENQRRLWNLIGAWEVDTKTVNEMNKQTDLLGVCTTHFHYDQNKLHSEGLKKTKPYTTSVIRHFRCTLCMKYFRVFCRVHGCDDDHCWSIGGKTVQIPCIGQKICPGIKEFPSLIQNTKSARQMQYICCACYVSQGGHLHDMESMAIDDTTCTPDKHAADSRKIVRLLGEWMLDVAETEDDSFNDRLAKLAAPMLKVFQKPEPMETELPSVSPLMVIPILKANKKHSSTVTINAGTSRKFGKDIAELIWKSRGEVNKNRDTLEKPNTLYDYQSAFPQILTSFFLGLISTLFKKRLEVRNRKNKNKPASLNPANKISRMTVFLSSIILATAFKRLKIFSAHTLASVCQKPKLLPSLRSFLESVNAISHTDRHERRLWRNRMQAADPTVQLHTGPFIWNVCVIDNIDLREATYKYGNVYDVAGKSFHATLRMIFQFKLPVEISSISDKKITLSVGHKIFGDDDEYIQEWLQKINVVFKALVTKNSFDMDEINKELVDHIDLGCRIEEPNVVILEAGDSPSNNKSIFNTCQAYFRDLDIEKGRLDIWADQAIHQRLIKFNDKNSTQSELRVGLGQWHTSNVMCTALTLMFSSYGIYNCAYELGVRYLEKFEYNSDYRATCRVLEMIWTSTGIALHNYLMQKGLTLEQLMKGDDNLVKVWALYFKWASFWKGHKIGIRRGNADMQFCNLAAFAPLFPCTGRVNYFKSVAQFLAEYQRYPQLQQLLQHACSVNITKEGHYLAFDEALEFFGVKFVKQNLKNRIIDEKDLKQQIKAVQSERARTDLLFSIFNDNHIPSESAHTINERSAAVEQLAKKMLEAFNSQSPDEHSLFRGCTQLTPTGYKNIFDSYSDGVERLQDFYDQEIINKEEPDSAGRARRSVVITHSKDILRVLTSKAQQEVESQSNAPVVIIE